MARDLNRSIKIFIDNSDAMANAQKLESRISSLRAELQKLSAEGKKDTKEYTSQEKAVKKLENSYASYQAKIKETERVLKNLSGATYKELTTTKRALMRELRNETRGTEQYRQKLLALHAVQKELNVSQKEMTNRMGSQGTIISRAAAGFNKYFGMITTGLATITGLSFTLRKLSQDAAEFEDVYADVMKTTGMTRDQVGDLNEEFKQMDTRTSREQLNMLARDAGKLGLSSKQDILDFVEAANQINVALGEDLGEGAIREVGKMADVFERSTKELDGLGLKEKMLAIGSAINEIGASSSANEDYLVQFAGRLGGVATQAGIGIDKIIGFASALDQDMQQVEMSATALQQFIIKLMGEPAKFAQIAGLEVKSFTTLLKTDANEAIKTVLRSLNEKGGFQQLIPYFDEMGLSGTRAVGVLSAMAGSIDKIDEAQKIANNSMVEAVSLTNEYNIKNNNANAELEKRRKAFKDAAEELGSRLNPALLKSTNILTYIVKFLPTLLDLFGKYGGLLIKTAALIVAYNVALRAQTTWTKLAMVEKIKLIAANVTEQASMIALNLRYVAGSKNMQEFNRSMKALFATMKLNPWALAITALTAIGILLYENARRTRNLTNTAKAQADITKIAAENTARERAELDLLISTARNEKLSKEEREKAIKKLNEISPEYLANLKLENINTMEATTAIDNYTTALMNNARQKAIADKVTELYAKRLEKETDIAEQNARKQGAGSEIRNLADRKIQSITDEIKLIDDQIKMYDNLNQTILETNKNKTSTTTGTSNGGSPDETQSVPSAPSGDSNNKKYEEGLKMLEYHIAREKALIQQKYIDGVISAQEYNRQLEYLELERLRKSLKLSGITFEQQKEIELKIFDTKNEMLRRIRDEEEQHEAKLNEIRENAEKARMEGNWNTLRTIAKQNEENYKAEFELENKRKADLAAIGFDFANEMGSLVAGAMSGNEDIIASSLKSIITMGLDLLKIQVQMAIAGATAQSLAQPDSIATLGASGFARAAIIVGAIEAAFAVVKGLVGSVLGKIGNTNSSQMGTTSDTQQGRYVVVPQRAIGKYDVIGAGDGQAYSGVPYIGSPRTGVVATPTLIAEQGHELVVSSPDLNRLQRHINYPMVIQAINDARSGVVPQRAEGNYSSVPTHVTPSPYDLAIIAEVRDLLKYLKNNGVQSYFALSELQRKQQLLIDSQKIGKK